MCPNRRVIGRRSLAGIGRHTSALDGLKVHTLLLFLFLFLFLLLSQSLSLGPNRVFGSSNGAVLSTGLAQTELNGTCTRCSITMPLLKSLSTPSPGQSPLQLQSFNSCHSQLSCLSLLNICEKPSVDAMQ